MIQNIIYYSILIVCFVVSFHYERARHNYFWLYFLLVLCYEFFFSYKLIGIDIYGTSAILYSLFFVIIFFRELSYKNHVKCIVYMVVTVIGIYLYTEKSYSINLGIMMAFIFIILGLIWLYNAFKINNQLSLIERQFFWISISLLLWGVFFLFRLIPMHLFEQTDIEFLRTLNTIFQWVTIVSYFIFFKGLLCKS